MKGLQSGYAYREPGKVSIIDVAQDGQPGNRSECDGMTGRPKGSGVTYTRKVADVICAELADGKTLRETCRQEGMPPESTVRLWALDDRDGFAARYARAREIGYHAMADELFSIADDGQNDWMERNGSEDGSWTLNGEHIARSRLRVDTRKWMLAKALPKIYGEKVGVEHSGEVTAQVIRKTIYEAAPDRDGD